MDFIRQQFLAVEESGRQVYCHYTIATDTKRIQMVMAAVKDLTLRIQCFPDLFI